MENKNTSNTRSMRGQQNGKRMVQKYWLEQLHGKYHSLGIFKEDLGDAKLFIIFFF